MRSLLYARVGVLDAEVAARRLAARAEAENRKQAVESSADESADESEAGEEGEGDGRWDGLRFSWCVVYVKRPPGSLNRAGHLEKRCS